MNAAGHASPDHRASGADAHARLTRLRTHLEQASGGRYPRRRRDLDSIYLLSGFARGATCGLWLHERDHDRADYDGHPDRSADEIAQWAREHDLPYFDDQVHFPDLRIECEEVDGRRLHEDVEVLTIHYRGGHAAAAARSGFTAYRGFSARVGGRSGGGRTRGGAGFAAEMLG